MYRQEEVKAKKAARASRAPFVRALLYLVLSASATGIIAGVQGCDTYSGRGKFWDCFWLYSIPIPMALGVLKIPTQVVGLAICSLINPTRSRALGWLLLAAFFIGLGVHWFLAHDGWRESWGWFPFTTVDFAILSVIAFSVRQEKGPWWKSQAAVSPR